MMLNTLRNANNIWLVVEISVMLSHVIHLRTFWIRKTCDFRELQKSKSVQKCMEIFGRKWWSLFPKSHLISHARHFIWVLEIALNFFLLLCIHTNELHCVRLHFPLRLIPRTLTRVYGIYPHTRQERSSWDNEHDPLAFTNRPHCCYTATHAQTTRNTKSWWRERGFTFIAGGWLSNCLQSCTLYFRFSLVTFPTVATTNMCALQSRTDHHRRGIVTRVHHSSGWSQKYKSALSVTSVPCFYCKIEIVHVPLCVVCQRGLPLIMSGFEPPLGPCFSHYEEKYSLVK